MIYKCIEDFEIPVINENGMMTESVLKVTSGMFFKESKDNALSGAEIKLESIFDDTFIEISKETLKPLFKDIEFIDLLEMQKQLDEEVAKPRDNGFVPRIRSRKDIILSMIAEIIEFNEETEHSHKTWKFKKRSEYSAIIEEATDILFFYLQLVNHAELEKFQIEAISQLWNKVWNYDDFYCDCDTEVDLIRTITRTDCYTYPWLMDVLMALILLYKGNAFLKNGIIQTYVNKWQKNMGRIKEDWSK